MDWSKYSSLKSGSKVSFGKEKQVVREQVLYKEGDSELRDAKSAVKYKEGDLHIPDDKKVGDVQEAALKAIEVGDEKEAKQEREYVALSQKRWDGESGEALDDSKREFSLSDLEREKSRFDDEIARAKAQSDGLKAAIADFKKV